MTDSLIRDLKALEADGFTGTLTLHFDRGTVKLVDQNKRYRPKADDGPREISEAGGERDPSRG